MQSIPLKLGFALAALFLLATLFPYCPDLDSLVTTRSHTDLNQAFHAFDRPFCQSLSDISGTDFALTPAADFRSAFKEYFSPAGYCSPYSSLLRHHSLVREHDLVWRLRTLWGSTYTTMDEGDASFVYMGLLLDGEYRRLSFATQAWKGHFTGDEEAIYRSPLIDGYTKQEDSEVYLDNLNGYMALNGDEYRVEIGRGRFQTGSGISGSVILSDYANDYGYLAGELRLGDFNVVVRHAELAADSISLNEPDNRYLAQHYLEWNPGRFRVSFGENIIYGNRSIDINYLTPLFVWRVLEHNLHDRDNCLIFFTGDFFPTESDHAYVNFLLDEFAMKKLTTDWWGNKYALQAGISHDWGTVLNRTAVEVVAVRPWTYTHCILVDRFTHDGRPLGFPEGSNLVQFTCEANLDLSHGVRLDTWHAYKIQGSLGSDVFQNYNTRPDDSATWLEGTRTHTLTDRAVLTYDYNAHHRFRLGIEAVSEKGVETSLTYTIGWQTIF